MILTPRPATTGTRGGNKGKPPPTSRTQQGNTQRHSQDQGRHQGAPRGTATASKGAAQTKEHSMTQRKYIEEQRSWRGEIPQHTGTPGQSKGHVGSPRGMRGATCLDATNFGDTILHVLNTMCWMSLLWAGGGVCTTLVPSAKKWGYRGSNPGTTICQSSALPLGYGDKVGSSNPGSGVLLATEKGWACGTQGSRVIPDLSTG